jgi:copper chaperone NosL
MRISYLSFLTVVLLFSCQDAPAPIAWNKDACNNCNMSITDPRFGAVSLSQKSRTYKFDDLSCMMQFQNEHPEIVFKGFYLHDFKQKGKLMSADTAHFVSHESIRSPMKGHTAAFGSKNDAASFAQPLSAPLLKWKDVSDNW